MECVPLIRFGPRFKMWRGLNAVRDLKCESSTPYSASRGSRHAGHTREVSLDQMSRSSRVWLRQRRTHVRPLWTPEWTPAERGEHVPAYDKVKVWEVDETPRPRSRPPLPSRPRGPDSTRSGPRRFDDTKERAERNAKLGVWARLLAVALLGGAILWWPYVRSCGFGLAAYLAASAMIVVGGIWVVACTWILRMARTHAVAMLVALWGVSLIAIEVLPRVGYAAQSATWLCR